jgi:hypothetical protein
MRERWIALSGDNGTSSRTTFVDRGTKHVTLVVRDSCTHSHRHRQLMGAVNSPGFQSNWVFLLCLVQPRLTWRQTAAKWYHQCIVFIYICVCVCCCCYLQPRGSQIQLRKTKYLWSRFYFFCCPTIKKALKKPTGHF